MNLYAMRGPYFLKLSSSSATSELYCSTSTLAGTPAGYCFNQIFSIATLAGSRTERRF